MLLCEHAGVTAWELDRHLCHGCTGPMGPAQQLEVLPALALLLLQDLMGCKAVCYFLCWCFFSVLLSFLFIAHLLMLSRLWHCCTTKSSWSCGILMLISSIGHNPHSKWKMCSFTFELLKASHGSADADMSQPCDHNYPGFSPVL